MARHSKPRKGSTSPLVVVFAGAATLFCTVAILYLKYGLDKCNLNTGEDDLWTFGQPLAIVMLFAPALSAFEVLLSRSSLITSLSDAEYESECRAKRDGRL